MRNNIKLDIQLSFKYIFVKYICTDESQCMIVDSARGPITWSIFNPGVEFSSVDKAENSSLPPL
jgi:hypothetical protein